MPSKATTRKAKSNTKRNCKTTSQIPKTTEQTKSHLTKETRCITYYFPTVSKRLLAAKTKAEEYNKQVKYYIENKTDPKENLVITEFEGKGRGIVASTTIRKGCFICEYSGDLIKLDEAKDREYEYEMSQAGCYMYYFNWNNNIFCVDATKPTSRYGRLINHSRKAPNCKTKVFEFEGNPRLIFIALRDIQPNEEILYDYGERDPNAIRSNPWLKTT